MVLRDAPKQYNIISQRLYWQGDRKVTGNHDSNVSDLEQFKSVLQTALERESNYWNTPSNGRMKRLRLLNNAIT